MKTQYKQALKARLSVTLVTLVFCISSIYGQEICNNGIDDDNDGFIDLNDTDDCVCTAVVTTSIGSIIPNSSFEENTGCPSAQAQLNLATNWIQASPATSDYWHSSCAGGFIPSWFLPVPDGDGCVGARFVKNYQENVGAVLSQPLLANTNYNLSLQIISGTCDLGFVDLGPNNYGAIELTIYGSPDPTDLPFTGTLCPMGTDPDWQILGTYLYNPLHQWQEITIPLNATVDINVVTIGPPCTLPPGYPEFPNPVVNMAHAYFGYDDLLLNAETTVEAPIVGSFYNAENNVWVTNGTYVDPISGDTVYVGNICPDIVELTGTDVDPTIGTIQWYHEGIALLGENNVTLTMNIEDFEYGDYQMTFTPDSINECTVSIYTALPPTYPQAAFNATVSGACFPADLTIEDESIYPGGDIIDWDWSLNNIPIGSGTPNLTVPFPNIGTHEITLISESENFCRDTVSETVSLANAIIIDFNYSTACAGSPTDFLANIINQDGQTITGWSWDFGDGNTGNGLTPAHTFANGGVYNVTLTITGSFNCDVSLTLPVVVEDMPHLSISSDLPCVGNQTTFTNLSNLGNNGTFFWNWDFGDQSVSNLFSPTHQYDSSGIYNVVVTLASLGGCQIKDSIECQVLGSNTAVDFEIENFCLSDTTSFTDLTNTDGIITGYAWDFGDSEESNQQNPEHIYNDTGQYDITLVVTDDDNCSHTGSKSLILHPSPEILFETTSNCLSEASQIINLSQINNGGSITSWNWDFGDGNTSEDQHPNHTYENSGVYDITLEALSDQGCQRSAINEIIVSEVISSFGQDFDSGCGVTCGSVRSTAESTYGEINHLIWNFDDGSSAHGVSEEFCVNNSSNLDPLYQGMELIAINEMGCSDTLRLDSAISIWPVPIASFDVDRFTAEIIDPVFQFTDESTGASEGLWSFGDGNYSSELNPSHSYEDHEVYTVELEVENEYGCKDQFERSIEVKPVYNIYVANAFTPQEDGINDLFRPIVNGDVIVDFNFQIYDRDGHVVFESKDPEKHWNGTYLGSEDYYVMDGVYNWILQVEFINNTDVFKDSGSIVVIR